MNKLGPKLLELLVETSETVVTWRDPSYTQGWEKRTLSSFQGQGLFQTLCVGIGLSLVLGRTWSLLCVTLGLDRAWAEDGQSLAGTVLLHSGPLGSLQAT